MKQMAYVVYREDEFIVAKCLNVDVSSFGAARTEAVANLKEVVELYLEKASDSAFMTIADLAAGVELVNA